MDKIIRNVIIFAALILVIAGIFVGVVISNRNNTNTQSSVSSNANTNSVADNKAIQASGEVQNVKLSVVSGSYVLTPSVLKKDVPVRLEADLNSLKGCSRDVVISAFGVRKYVKDGDNIITFTPTKTGIINIACSMNMYRGTFTVVDTVTTTTNTQGLATGTVPVVNNQVALSSDNSNTNVALTHTCGGASGSGGCGCGG